MAESDAWRHHVRAMVLLVLVSAGVRAADLPLGFDDPALHGRYEHLLDELRCMVCQNQSLADSHADLAQDMRNLVHQMLAEGRSDREVIDFLVERYGDFVLYRPPLGATTVALWTGPFVLLIAAAVVVFRRRRSVAAPPLDDAERARLAALLERAADGDRERPQA